MLMPIIIGIVVLGFIGYAIFFNRKAIVKRKLRRTGAKSMAEVQTGEWVRISGSAELIGNTLTAPLSGRKCSYYHVQVERRRSNGKSTHWVDLVNEELAGDVVIREGNHYAIIKTGTVKSYLQQDREYRSGFLNDAEDHLKHFLESKGIDTVSWIGMNKTLRYKEGVLEKGEILTVAGMARWIKKAETKLDIPSEKILVIEASSKDAVYFSDEAV
jgi:hypothetical protein